MSFDLEEFRNGRDAITRDGRRAYFVGLDFRADPFCRLVVHIGMEAGPRTLSEQGALRNSYKSSCDLVSMAPKTVTWHCYLIKKPTDPSGYEAVICIDGSSAHACYENSEGRIYCRTWQVEE